MPTVTLGLVRLHLEKVQPPRSLFVPFELGRPLGEPNDPAFQQRVLRQALALLERTDGPVILEDFAEAAAGARDHPEWHPPAIPPPGDSPGDAAGWSRALGREMELLRPVWEAARLRSGRTTVGVSQQPPENWPDFAAAFLTGALPRTAGHATPALSLRFLVDDVKAFYGEAGQAGPVAPSSRQVDRWFWRHTIAGRFLIALRAACIGSPNTALHTVASRFFVPRPYLPE